MNSLVFMALSPKTGGIAENTMAVAYKRIGALSLGYWVTKNIKVTS